MFKKVCKLFLQYQACINKKNKCNMEKNKLKKITF